MTKLFTVMWFDYSSMGITAREELSFSEIQHLLQVAPQLQQQLSTYEELNLPYGATYTCRGGAMIIVEVTHRCWDITQHELGHIHTGTIIDDTCVLGDEYAADQWAIQHGADIRGLLTSILRQLDLRIKFDRRWLTMRNRLKLRLDAINKYS